MRISRRAVVLGLLQAIGLAFGAVTVFVLCRPWWHALWPISAPWVGVLIAVIETRIRYWLFCRRLRLAEAALQDAHKLLHDAANGEAKGDD